MNAENSADTPASHNPKRTEEATNEISHDLTEERIKTNLGALNKQISTLTQLLNQLIQESSERNSSTADTRTQQTQSRPSPSREAGSSGALPAREIGSAGPAPDIHTRSFE